MKTYNLAMIAELFPREAVLLGGSNVFPFHRAAMYFGEENVMYVKTNCPGGDYWNSCSINGVTVSYLTYLGFKAAASAFNAQQLQKEVADNEENEGTK